MSNKLLDIYKEFVRDKYHEGEIVPWWKGLVTENSSNRTITVAPIPFNLLFALVLWFWWSMRVGLRSQMRFVQQQERKRKCQDLERSR